MRTIYAETHALHRASGEFAFGAFVEHWEKPERAEAILSAVRAAGLGPVEAPRAFPRTALTAVHDEGLVAFLEGAAAEWAASGRPEGGFACTWRAPRMRADRVPASIDGKLGFWSFDSVTPVMAGTWAAAKGSAECALTAAALVAGGERAAFALCRPPGHHAGRDYFGGFCFLNNAAIAAQSLIDGGAARVAILDVDYHHGNGTQDIFYDRGDVLFASIHADPSVDYPFFLGHADETGAGAGEGANLNLPLPHGTGWAAWSAAFEAAAARIAAFGADAVVLSLGVDPFEKDPISRFKLTSDEFGRLGARIAGLGLPTVFVMEGGYAVAEIGLNVANVLTGFSAA